MEFIPVKTRILLPPKDDLFETFDSSLPRLYERDVLLITSKVLAIHQGRCVLVGSREKDDLIKEEADSYLERADNPVNFLLTIKDSTLIASAGVDESNGNGYYVLWPNNTQEFLKEIWQYLTQKYKLTELGIIATDSHSMPLRYGVLGLSIGFFGIEPFDDYREKGDLFGRPYQYTRINVPDALSAAGVFVMGEGDEKTPLLIIRNAARVQFTEKDCYKDFVIPPKEDLYYPLLCHFPKKP